MKRQTENRAAQLSFGRTDKCGSQEHATEAILEREAKADKRRFDLIREVLLDFEPTLAEEKEWETYQTAFVLLAAFPWQRKKNGKHTKQLLFCWRRYPAVLI